MKEQAQTFSYTAQRTSYLIIVGTLLFFMCIENSVVALLLIVLIHILLLKLALLFVLVCFLTFIITRLTAPLRTQHSLTQTQLSLRYGSAFRANIARSDVVDIQAVHERITLFQAIMPQYEEKKHRIVASFSEQGQVLLYLNKPHAFKVNSKSHMVDTLLINVDKREELLQALGLSNNRVEELTTSRDRCITSWWQWKMSRDCWNVSSRLPRWWMGQRTRYIGPYKNMGHNN